MNRVSFASYKSVQHLNFIPKTPSSISSRNRSLASRGMTGINRFPTIKSPIPIPLYTNLRNASFKGFYYFFV